MKPRFHSKIGFFLTTATMIYFSFLTILFSGQVLADDDIPLLAMPLPQKFDISKVQCIDNCVVEESEKVPVDPTSGNERLPVHLKVTCTRQYKGKEGLLKKTMYVNNEDFLGPIPNNAADRNAWQKHRANGCLMFMVFNSK